jgi:CDGSH-type Zn-finger protein
MRITVIENGPLLIETAGDSHYSGEARSHKSNDRVALCRCGQSERKPYCDGSHKATAFVAPGGVLELTPK